MLTGDNEKNSKSNSQTIRNRKSNSKCITKTKSRRNQKAKTKWLSHDVWRWHK